jgi:hypothetical protein
MRKLRWLAFALAVAWLASSLVVLLAGIHKSAADLWFQLILSQVVMVVWAWLLPRCGSHDDAE